MKDKQYVDKHKLGLLIRRNWEELIVRSGRQLWILTIQCYCWSVFDLNVDWTSQVYHGSRESIRNTVGLPSCGELQCPSQRGGGGGDGAL